MTLIFNWLLVHVRAKFYQTKCSGSWQQR